MSPDLQVGLVVIAIMTLFSLSPGVMFWWLDVMHRHLFGSTWPK